MQHISIAATSSFGLTALERYDSVIDNYSFII
jgi:hypothetical protein